MHLGRINTLGEPSRNEYDANLTVCQDCFAVVVQTDQERHGNWHLQLEQVAKDAHAGALVTRKY